MRYLAVGLALLVIGCSGSSPSSPSTPAGPAQTTPPPSTPTGTNRVVNALTDDGVVSATITADGAGQATTDATGAFDLRPATAGTFNVTIAAAGFVERRTRLLLPSPASTLTLIPSTFDLAAFDAMARTHEGQLVRWTTTPNLTIQRNVVDYADDAGGVMVLNEPISDADLNCLESRAREAISLMSGGVLTAGTTQILSTTPGTRVEGTATGAITVWGARNLGTAAGRGGISYRIPALTVAGGVVYLEVAAPGGANHASCGGGIRVLRHEVGHALGYQHVTTRASIMQPLNAPDINDADRQAFAVFSRRSPGNRSPDTDASTFRANALGRLARWLLP